MSILISTLGRFPQDNSQDSDFDPNEDMFPELAAMDRDGNSNIDVGDLTEYGILNEGFEDVQVTVTSPANEQEPSAGQAIVGGDAIDNGPKQKPRKEIPERDRDTLKKNRNGQKQFYTLKDKLEKFQSNLGYESDFVLLVKNNFVQKVGSSGPVPATAGKTLVVGSGNLFDSFKKDELLFDIDEMEVLQAGKTMNSDRQFLKDYIKNNIASTKQRKSVPNNVTEHVATSGISSGMIFNLGQQTPIMPVNIPSPPLFVINQGSSLPNSIPQTASKTKKSTKRRRTKSSIFEVEENTDSVDKDILKRKGKKRLTPAESDLETSGTNSDITVHDSSDYDTEASEMAKKIEIINEKNRQKRLKKIQPSEDISISESDVDNEDSDHGTEVRGAGADKKKKQKKKKKQELQISERKLTPQMT